MNNAELYMEFKEEYVTDIIVERNEFCKILKKMKKGTVIGEKDGKYQIFYMTNADKNNREQIKDKLLSLKIDPAARIRFEGSLDEYDELLKEIKKMGLGDSNFKVYSKLREDEANSDFFIADVYYLMQ